MVNSRGFATRQAHVLESKLQRKILDDLQGRNVFSFKVMASNKRGVPDIILCVGGKFVALEVKRPIKNQAAKQKQRGVVSNIQRLTMASIYENNGLALVVDDFDDYLHIINTLERLSDGRAN